MNDLIYLFAHALMEQEHYNEVADEWQFADGSACGVCTHSGMQVALAFNGVVLGYYAKDNPMAQIGATYSQGHDFALIADRWLVDHWAWRTTDLLELPLLDLAVAGDRARALRLYGPRSFWSLVWSARSPVTSFAPLSSHHETARRHTAHYLATGQAPSPDFVVEECTSATEAQRLADHYDQIIAQVLEQQAEQDRP